MGEEIREATVEELCDFCDTYPIRAARDIIAKRERIKVLEEQLRELVMPGGEFDPPIDTEFDTCSYCDSDTRMGTDIELHSEDCPAVRAFKLLGGGT